MIYLVAQVKRATTQDEVNALLRSAADGPLKKYVQYTEEELVSSDFKRSPYSSIIDAKLTNANGDLVQIAAWYDNEWGYSCRLADVTADGPLENALGRSLALDALQRLARRVDVRGQARARARGSQRPAQGRGGRRRHAHRSPPLRRCAGCASAARARSCSRISGRPDGKRGPRATRCGRSPAALASAARHAGRVRRRLRRAGGRGRGRGAAPTATSCCSRTCASIPRKKRTIRPSPRELAALGDLYVNDAFGTAHRAHASTEGVAHLIFRALRRLLDGSRTRGARRADRAIRRSRSSARSAARRSRTRSASSRSLLERGRRVRASAAAWRTRSSPRSGVDVGTSLRDADLEPAQEDLELAAQQRRHACTCRSTPSSSTSFDADDRAHTVAARRRRRRDDPRHRSRDRARVRRASCAGAKTIVFNGPMGVYEKPAYRNGTRVVGEAIARGDARRRDERRRRRRRRRGRARCSASPSAMTHVSTGGGATLEFLEGKTLPGVAALEADDAARDARCAVRSSPATGRCTRRSPRRARSCASSWRSTAAATRSRSSIAPPFTALAAVARSTARFSALALGAQDDARCGPRRVHRRDQRRRCCSNSACAT